MFSSSDETETSYFVLLSFQLNRQILIVQSAVYSFSISTSFSLSPSTRIAFNKFLQQIFIIPRQKNFSEREMIFFTKQIGYTIFRASDFHFVYNILVLCIWSRAYSNLFPTKCLHLEYSDVLSCSYHTRCHVTTDKRQSTGPVSRKTVGGEKNIFFLRIN